MNNASAKVIVTGSGITKPCPLLQSLKQASTKSNSIICSGTSRIVSAALKRDLELKKKKLERGELQYREEVVLYSKWREALKSKEEQLEERKKEVGSMESSAKDLIATSELELRQMKEEKAILQQRLERIKAHLENLVLDNQYQVRVMKCVCKDMKLVAKQMVTSTTTLYNQLSQYD